MDDLHGWVSAILSEVPIQRIDTWDSIAFIHRDYIFDVEENIVGKCWLPAFSPYSAMVSKSISFRAV